MLLLLLLLQLPGISFDQVCSLGGGLCIWAMARTKCELTSSVCDVLLKCNVSNLDAGAYLQEDVELVVAAYVGFYLQ